MSFLSKLFGKSEVKPASAKKVKVDFDNGIFEVHDFFAISGKGTVAVGDVKSGGVAVGFKTNIGGKNFTIKEIEIQHKQMDSAKQGDFVGVLFEKEAKDVLKKGEVLEFVK